MHAKIINNYGNLIGSETNILFSMKVLAESQAFDPESRTIPGHEGFRNVT